MLFYLISVLILVINCQQCPIDQDCGPFPLPFGKQYRNRYPSSPITLWIDVPKTQNMTLVVVIDIGFVGQETVCFAGNLASRSLSECIPSNGGNLTLNWVQELDNDDSNGRVLLNLWCHEPSKCAPFYYGIQSKLVPAGATNQLKVKSQLGEGCCKGVGGQFPVPCCAANCGYSPGGLNLPRCGTHYPDCEICCPAGRASVCQSASLGYAAICSCRYWKNCCGPVSS